MSANLELELKQINKKLEVLGKASEKNEKLLIQVTKVGAVASLLSGIDLLSDNTIKITQAVKIVDELFETFNTKD